MSLIEKIPEFLQEVEWTPGTIVLAVVLFTVGAIGSKLFYNIYLHPLRKFPGPKLAAASPLYFTYNNVGGQYPTLVKALHDKYGPIVRLGPNQLSFSSATSWRDIYNQNPSRKFFLKSDFYDMEGGGTPNLDTDRDPVSHARVRKVMAPAFSYKAVNEVEPVVQGYVDKLVRQAGNFGSVKEGMDVCKWYLCTTFDIVADLAFGARFHSLDTGEPHFWILMLTSNIRYMGMLGELHRLFGISVGSLMRIVPKSLLVEFNKRLEYTAEMVTNKIKAQEKRSDFLSPMIEGINKGTMTFDEVRENAGALVIGGTETLTTFFSSATYYLTTHPEVAQKLKDEVRGTFATYQDITASGVEKLPYLNAVIQEVFRIFPPSPYALPRLSPGETVDGVYIPKGVEVFTTGFAATHSEENFHDPYTFKPERWIDPNCRDHKEAAQPLLLGPRNCIGRYLAWMEMRLILAKLFYTYDLERTNKDHQWLQEAKFAIFWMFTPLHVRFTRRAGVKGI